MAENTEWLMLEDAIRVYGDPRLWAAYKDALVRAKNMPPQPSWIGSAPREWPASQMRHRRQSGSIREALTLAERALQKDFKDRLRAGALIAVGIREPIGPQSEPELISAPLWAALHLDLATNCVRSQGLRYCGVQIRLGGGEETANSVEPPFVETENRSPEAAVEKISAPESGSSQQALPTVKPAARRRGRPSIRPYLEAEMRRRAAAGELLDGIAAECRAMHEWAKRNIHGEKIPGPGSMEEALRSLYWELREEKKRR